ncbi:SRP-independent targeting protein 3 [Exophiala dermatitidis]
MNPLSPQITNLVIILGMMQVSKRIPFDDPQVLTGVRVLYVASNLIIFALYYYIGLKIKAKKDMTTLKYVEPAPMGSAEEPKLVTTTVQEYDQSQLAAAYKAQLMGVAMMAFMHLYLKYTNPLLIQSIIPVKGALESNLVKVHVFGKPAVGELKRPWKAGGGMMGMGAGEAKSDKASIEAAERAGRGGAKEE